MKRLLELFWEFFKLGLFTFGGGYAMVPHLKQALIDKKKWMTQDEVLDMLAIAESTPGSLAINMATYVGYKQKGFWGSLVSTLGVTIPAFIIILVISLFFNNMMSNVYVQYAFVGIKAAMAFLILKTGVEFFIKMKKNVVNILLFGFVFSIMLLCEIFAFNFSAVVLIIFGGLIGFALSFVGQNKLENKNKEIK